MAKIRLLDAKTADKIAAGEVILNPASVMKELLENSIDAQSSNIIVEIVKGGKELISIKDNGIGISPEDAKLAFKRHSTSKISTADDLDSIVTLGFRGEALASIAAISKVFMKTREPISDSGIYVHVNGGEIVKFQETGCSIGTAINVEDIFYNTPARYKYLKKDSIEAGYISQIVERIALSHPEISFRFINDGKQIFHTPGNNDLYSCIYSLYGQKFSEGLIKLDYENSPLEINGYIGKPEISKSNRQYQIFFINKRYIKSKLITQAVEEAYKNLIMIHKFPVAILNIELPQRMLDINVHPAKTEVRFQNESLIYLLAKQAIYEQLSAQSLIPEVTLNKDHRDTSEKDNVENYEQKEIDLNTSNSNLKGHYSNHKNSLETNDKKDKLLEKKNYNTLEQVVDKSEVKDQAIKYIGDKKDGNKDLLEKLLSGKIIGQVFATYIIVEVTQGLLLIDQHAAHEKIAYNKLKIEYKNDKVISQRLLSPYSIDLSFYEHQKLMEFLPMITKLGYEIEDFGSNSILLRSVPIIFNTPQNEQHLLEIINILEDLKDIHSTYEKEEKLISMACKGAIKANDHLEEKEIIQLIHDLVHTDDPYTCPHGRPTIIKLTKYELEKLFKRIQ